jgi:hypothetical protein
MNLILLRSPVYVSTSPGFIRMPTDAVGFVPSSRYRTGCVSTVISANTVVAAGNEGAVGTVSPVAALSDVIC